MPWGRLDDGLYDHPKLDALGRSKLAAVGLWTLAISWSNRRLTDGFVPTDRIPMLGGTKAIAETLVAAGMFDRADDGYVVHDFLAFNESREQVEIRRENDRKRKRSPAGYQPDSDGKPAGNQPDSKRIPNDPPARAGSRPVPSRPVPTIGTPQPPASGGHQGRRANGDSPRQMAAKEREKNGASTKAKHWRAQQRQLAYHRGEISEAQAHEMNAADTPLEEIPGWAERQAEIAAEAAL